METLQRPALEFTERAWSRVREILSKPENQGKAVRIFVLGGGCAGLQYSMALGFVKEDDYVIENNGNKVVVDPRSMEFIKEGQVDYYESIQSSGFSFKNPNAIASCGCGISFKTAQKTDMQKAKPCH